MPKLKSHRSLRKKVKVTKNGKIKRHKAGKSHLLSHKNAKRRRSLRKADVMEGTMAKKIKSVL